MNHQSVEKILIALEKAQQNLQSIRKQFAEDTALLAIYEPSAKEVVRIYQKRLEMELAERMNMDVSISDKSDTDFWIHIEGDDFKNGHGPVTFIGNYLNKLNTACKDTIRLFGEPLPIGREDSLFYLAGTAAGSLKIGIKKNLMLDIPNGGEESLFAEDEEWENIQHLSKKNRNIEMALSRLLRTMESAGSEEELRALKEEVGDDNKFLKLLNYARELVPSAKSGVDSISFEAKNKDVRIKTETRMLIHNYAKNLLPERQFVSGIAAIRLQDMDSGKIVARPFRYEDETINDLECILPKEINGKIYLDQIVALTGFLIKGRNNGYSKLDVDSIEIQSQDDI